MKLATFTHGGSTRIGVVADDSMVDLSAAAPELPREMMAFLDGGRTRARARTPGGERRAQNSARASQA